MASNHPSVFKKSTSVLLGLLVLVALFIGSSLLTLAAENKQADPNQPKQKQKAGKQKDKKPPRPDHSHPAFTQRTKERNRLVSRWIERQGVRDPNVLTAMRTVPRHEFVRPGDSRRAYQDQPIPIGLGQTISQPYIVAYMTEALKLRPDHKVLEVGTGSAYQAAVCAEIAQEVYTIEIIEALAKSAKKRLKELGYPNVSVKAADGYFGWPEHGPFDAIIVTAAAGLVPPPLIDQLKPDGRMILPLGSPYGSQTLVLITRDDKGEVRSKAVLPVRFVPMTGHILESKRPPKK
jgi:protein-L-isoaspartate(D-aspartate) O-methyltransferase